jgi:hypothetical protein
MNTLEMPKSEKNIHDVVHEMMSIHRIKPIVESLASKKVKLWGVEKGCNFNRDSLYLALYHDLTGDGYGKILNEVKRWHRITPRSFQHNTQVTLYYLYSLFSQDFQHVQVIRKSLTRNV